MKHLPLACLSLLALWALSGCATPERETTKPYALSTGLPVEPANANDLGYETRWAHTVALKNGQHLHSARLFDDLLVVLEQPENFVTAINVADGSLAWKAVVGHPLHDVIGVVADEDNVYVNTPTRLYTLRRHNGDEVDASDLKYRVSNRPELINGLAVFGSTDGTIFAHDITGGYMVWAYALEANITSPPVQSGLQVFTADSVGQFAMLDASTGDLLWRNSTYDAVTAPPIVDRNFVIVASEDQSVYSYNASTGEQRWRPYFSPKPLVDKPVVLGQAIYQYEPDIGLTSIDATTGNGNWTLDKWAQAVMLTEDEDVLAQGERSLLVLDEETGEVKQTIPTRWLQYIIPGPDGSLICISPNGDMLRLDPS